LFCALSRAPRAEDIANADILAANGGIAPPLGGSDGIPPGTEAAAGRFGGLRVLAHRPDRYHGLVLVSDLCVLTRPKSAVLHARVGRRVPIPDLDPNPGAA
jgi:hypothetical protein